METPIGEVLAALLVLDMIPMAASVVPEIDDTGHALQVIVAVFGHVVVVPELAEMQSFVPGRQGVLDEYAVLVFPVPESVAVILSWRQRTRSTPSFSGTDDGVCDLPGSSPLT